MSFPQFTLLPAELQHQIWNTFLLHNDEGLVYPFTPHLFATDDLTDEAFRVRMPVPPLLGVSRDARAVTQSWIQRVGGVWSEAPPGAARSPDAGEGEAEGGGGHCKHRLTRAADWTRDVLYVGREHREEFEDLAMAVANGEGEGMGAGRRIFGEVRWIGVPAFTAYYSVEWIMAVCEEMAKLEGIVVVWGEISGGTMGKGGCFCVEAIEEVEMDDDQAADGVNDNDNNEEEEDDGMDDDDEDLMDTGCGPVVTLELPDVETGLVSREQGRLGGWMAEIQMLLATTEMDPRMAERMVDEENGDVDTGIFRAARMLRWEGTWREPEY